jgi:hypothetical protein
MELALVSSYLSLLIDNFQEVRILSFFSNFHAISGLSRKAVHVDRRMVAQN